MIKEDISPREVIGSIPPDCFAKPWQRSFGFLIRDFILFGLCAALIVWVDNGILALPISFIMGTVLTGIFVLGHECGHRSFSDNTSINNWVGEFTTSFALWPFHIWRLSHDTHHRHTHNIQKDIAWVPFTKAKFARIGTLSKAIYLYTRTTFFYIGSMFFTFYFIKDGLRGLKSRHFTAAELPAIRRSLLISFVVAAGYISLAYLSAGGYGLVFLFILPQIAFHFWLSTFTLFHHTHPENRFLGESEWTFARGQLDSTVHVAYPGWVEWLTHDISWHVPHHVCVGVPHYHLREAHRALKARFGKRVREEQFDWQLIRKTIDNCHLIDSKDAAGLEWQQIDGALVPLTPEA